MNNKPILTDDEIKSLIDLKIETPNLDYKLTAIWNKEHNNDRLHLTKDILAMANTRDGGKIILGVDDITKEFKGLSEEAYNSFEMTKVNQFVSNYADPSFTCNIIHKKFNDNKRVVVIDVPEFTEDPIVCKNNGHNNKNSLVLIKGGLYIRTSKCTSDLVSCVDETRTIIERGLNKKSDEILAKIRRLLATSEGRRYETQNKPSTNTATPTKLITEIIPQKSDYDKEIGEAIDYFKEKLEGIGGYWQVIAYPKAYNSKIFLNQVKAHEAITDSVVHLRGWDYPHDDGHGNSSNFAKGRQSFTVWEKHKEAWRMYKSGLFIWRGNYWEDARGYTDAGKKILSFVSAIYSVTEFLLFLKRLYIQQLKIKDIIELKIDLNDCKNRKLDSLEQGTLISGYYFSSEDIIPVVKEIQPIELEADPKSIARDLIKEIFMLFNWNNPSDSMIEGWQKRLIERGGF